MPRRATLMAAAGVILVGLAGAMFFRRDYDVAPKPEAPTADGEVLVRRRAAAAPLDVPSSPHLVGQIEPQPDLAAASSQARAASAAAHEGLVNPHSVAARYNPFAAHSSQPASSPASFAPPPAAPAAPDAQPPFATPATAAPERTHIVVDGDTLTDLAELYLGTSRRYPEIFESNRDVLRHPDLLPIGARLRIPGGGSPVAQSTAQEQDLVPIPSNAWRRGRGKQP